MGIPQLPHTTAKKEVNSHLLNTKYAPVAVCEVLSNVTSLGLPTTQ